MQERTGIITMKGNPLTLAGHPVEQGHAAPDVQLLDTTLSPAGLLDQAPGGKGGGVLVVAAVPSLDTDVCSIETRRFNQEAAKLDANVVVVSMDLPFAQARWIREHDVQDLTVLSDHRDAAFGAGWGVLIKELRLLARSVFVIDASGTVRHAQIVGEVAEEPDYEAVLAAVHELG